MIIDPAWTIESIVDDSIDDIAPWREERADMYSHDPLSGAAGGEHCKCFGCCNARRLAYAYQVLASPIAYRPRVEIVKR